MNYIDTKKHPHSDNKIIQESVSDNFQRVQIWNSNAMIENLTTQTPRIKSSDKVKVITFDDAHLIPAHHEWALQSQHNTIYKLIESVDDTINRAKDFGMVKVPWSIQNKYNVTLDDERNWYIADYATNTVLVFVYLPMTERKKARGIGSEIVKRALEDANNRLATVGGTKTVLSVREHWTKKFDRNTNLDVLNRELQKGNTNIDSLIVQTPAGKMITRQWYMPYRFAMSWWENKRTIDHVLIWYKPEK